MEPLTPENAAGPEDRVDTVLRRSCDCFNEQMACLEQKVAASPVKAVLIAAGAGYVARSLPLASMLAIPFRLAAKVAPPLLLAVGAAKIFEAVRCSGTCPVTDHEERDELRDLFAQRAAGE